MNKIFLLFLIAIIVSVIAIVLKKINQFIIAKASRALTEDLEHIKNAVSDRFRDRGYAPHSCIEEAEGGSIIKIKLDNECSKTIVNKVIDQVSIQDDHKYILHYDYLKTLRKVYITVTLNN